MSIEINRYNNDQKKEWDEFVRNSKNATFLFFRDFMDYHSDRFSDHSLMAYEGDKLIALLPACEFDVNTKQARIISHGGLSYGGVLSNRKMNASLMLEVFAGILSYYKTLGFQSLKYKVIPHIYHQVPAEEDIYALFRNNAELCQVDNSTTIFQGQRLSYSKSKKYGVKKASKFDLVYSQEQSADNLEAFFNLLAEVLQERHETNPTHTLKEMKLLASRFPENIKVHTVSENGELVAGTLIFLTTQVAHTQYLATSARGRENAALDWLLDTLINKTYKDIPYFNFGISNEEQGRVLNTGLCHQKEMFGGRSTAQLTYLVHLV